jgi:phage virion morphogenesis protein
VDNFTMEIQNNAISGGLAAVMARMADMSPVMYDISMVLVDGIEEAFARQADPASGAAWPHLSDTTIEAREKKGYWPGKMLQQTGRLVSSMVPDWGPTFAAAGTNVIYATTMHYGAERGEFGTTKHGAPIPWGDIPGHPFIGLSSESAAEILSLLSAYLVER